MAVEVLLVTLLSIKVISCSLKSCDSLKMNHTNGYMSGMWDVVLWFEIIFNSAGCWTAYDFSGQIYIFNPVAQIVKYIQFPKIKTGILMVVQEGTEVVSLSQISHTVYSYIIMSHLSHKTVRDFQGKRQDQLCE